MAQILIMPCGKHFILVTEIILLEWYENKTAYHAYQDGW